MMNRNEAPTRAITWMNVDNKAKWETPVMKDHVWCDFIYVSEVPKIGKLLHRDKKKKGDCLVPGGRKWGMTANEYGLSFWDYKDVLKLC